jgi:hypothetical protein
MIYHLTEHGPGPISKETYEVLFEFVRRQQRDLFNDLALMVGIPRGNLDDLWDHLSDPC